MPATSMRMPYTAPHLYAARIEAVEVVAAQRPVHRDLAAEQQLGVSARHEAHNERPELVRLLDRHLDRKILETVQPH
jgi:hypothetical protein